MVRILNSNSGFTKFAAVSLLVFAAAACGKPKPNNENVNADKLAGNGSIVGERDNKFDPQGSDSGKIAGLSTVFFEYDKATLSGDAKKKLAENADWIKKNAGVTVQIEGHTDERGSIEYNLSLGERRAKSVKQYLQGLGVDAKRMTVISYGEEKPLATGDTEAAYGKNRRANFVPLSQ